MVMKDPLVGALPKPRNTASPALTGEDETITGGVGTGMIPPQKSGLAPVPSPVTSTQVGGIPLSSDNVDTRQGGAGADLDLVKNRDVPDKWVRNMSMEQGSEKHSQIVQDIASSNRSGGDSGMSQEDINRQGTRANNALGMDTPEKAKEIVDGVVIDPLADTVKSEVESEVITPEVGLERMSQTMLQVGGAETEKDVGKVVDEAAGKIGETNKGRIKSMKESMVKWWKKGKNDPNEQVTGFMGGMNRQELGMFVFQWGAMMMANSAEGFGPAMGAASLGALQGHQGRQAMETEAKQQSFDNKIAQQKADAASETAAATTTRAEAYATNINEPRGGVGEWKREFYRSIGWSDEKIAQAAEGILTTEQIFDEVTTALRKEKADAASKETMSLPDNLRAKTTMPDKTKVPTAQLTEDQILQLATEASKKQVEARGALNPPPPEPDDAFSAAMSTYGKNP